MTIDRKNTKISAGGDVLSKEEIDHVLGNHKGARDHLVSRFLFTLNELLGRMFIGLISSCSHSCLQCISIIKGRLVLLN